MRPQLSGSYLDFLARSDDRVHVVEAIEGRRILASATKNPDKSLWSVTLSLC